MSLDDLDPLLTSAKRLACIGAISAAAKVEFGFLRSHLGISDSDMSKQLKPLVDADYVKSWKTGKGVTRRTWLEITDNGRVALEAHAAALRDLMNPDPATVEVALVPAEDS